MIIGDSMNNNRFKSGNVCSNCGAAIPYGSYVCKNCHSPLRLEQLGNNDMQKPVTKRDNSNLLVPTLLIFSVIIIIITIAVLLFIK